jgi:hypothetical protein
MNIDELAQKILINPLFLKLKTVIDNNPHHAHEDAYSHSLKTFQIAKQQIGGTFITNLKAKELFLEFINQPSEEFKKKDIMVVTALIHDIGKVLFYKEGDKIKPISLVNKDGVTRGSAHEYWGSTIAPKLLEEFKFSENTIRYISNLIRLHDTYNDSYFAGTVKWADNLHQIIDDIKARGEGFYIEALFNIYCDNFSVTFSDPQRASIIEVFNDPYLYMEREYFIK